MYALCVPGAVKTGFYTLYRHFHSCISNEEGRKEGGGGKRMEGRGGGGGQTLRNSLPRAMT